MKIKLLQNKPKNWILKAVSLCLAIMLWYFVVGEDQVDMEIKVPIEIINLPANLTIANEYKKTIDVSVRGPRSVIQDLRNRNITRPVNLSSAQPGTIVIKNDEQSIPMPRGILVQRLQPTNITLLLDTLSQRNFPVKAITEGTPAPGFELHKIDLDPDHLIISGPMAVLDKDQSLRTYAINLNGLERSTTLQVHLNLRPEFFDLIGETVVTAHLEVREKMVERTVENVAVTVKDAPNEAKIKPKAVAVKASIPQNLIRDSKDLAALFQATVSPGANGANGGANGANGANGGATELPVTVTPIAAPGHDPIKVLAVTPPTVQFTPAEPPPAAGK